MYPVSQDNTRIWWDGSEVHFIRWTEKALVFAWPNTYETAIHMPRGAVLRLVQKGILRIDGDMPCWMPGCIWEMRAEVRGEGYRPQATWQQSPVADPAPRPETSRPSYMLHRPADTPRAEQRAERFSAISRLIRKLTGGSEQTAVQARL